MSSDMHDLEKEFKELEKFGKTNNLGSLDDLEKSAGDLSGHDSMRISSPTKFKAMPVSVAAAAFVLFSGIVWYAYSDGVTQVTEDNIPLLKLAHAPKIIPDDPGGLKVPHQDKLVYNHLEGGSDDARVERLLPPVETPVKPPVAKPEQVAGTTSPPIPSITAPVKPKPKSSEPLVINPNASKDEKVATALTDGAPVPKASPVKEVVAEATPVTRTVAQERDRVSNTISTSRQVAVIERKQEEISSAPVVVKKKQIEAEIKKTEPVVQPAPKKVETKKETQVASRAAIDVKRDWRIQLGAVSSHSKAVSEFNRRQKAHKDLLGKLDLEVREVDVKGKKYFRIRLGPLTSATNARSLCSTLKKRSVDCIPVAPGK